MNRTVDLVSYLPPFMTEFKEIRAALEAENQEFVLVWKAAGRVLQNEFLASADEYGISRFEKILEILPSIEDTLESRRARVQARWMNTIPYTFRSLIEKMIALCGETDFKIIKDYYHYRIEFQTSLILYGQVEELERILERMLPCNLVIDSKNRIACAPNGKVSVGGAVQQTVHVTICTELKDKKEVVGVVSCAGYFSYHRSVSIAADSEKQRF